MVLIIQLLTNWMERSSVPERSEEIRLTNFLDVHTVSNQSNGAYNIFCIGYLAIAYTFYINFFNLSNDKDILYTFSSVASSVFFSALSILPRKTTNIKNKYSVTKLSSIVKPSTKYSFQPTFTNSCPPHIVKGAKTR